jgi:hypothetical protein
MNKRSKYLDNNEEESGKSNEYCLTSTKIDTKIKHRILNEFLLFATQINSSPSLDKAIIFDNDPDVNVSKE